ncbi:hypothetical protein [Pseudomonas asplenii]|uniref:hypothetical protein n=1 Tax=Pseudomonas asplenii TaxID=53407 RepID=UPI000376BC7F|nr:hypothetical protein [Pseudomonas fuscovaginae]
MPAFPDGHQLHAVYRSNINLREVSRSGSLANLPEDEFRLAHRSITGPEVLATIAGRSTGLQAFYVLMSDLNLIKYMPSVQPRGGRTGHPPAAQDALGP